MSEQYVQVPVSLLRRVLVNDDERDAGEAERELTALLSQPTPTAEQDLVEVQYTLNESVKSTALVEVDGDVATGHDKYVPNYPVKLFRTDHGWDARIGDVTPPKEDR